MKKKVDGMMFNVEECKADEPMKYRRYVVSKDTNSSVRIVIDIDREDYLPGSDTSVIINLSFCNQFVNMLELTNYDRWTASAMFECIYEVAKLNGCRGITVEADEYIVVNFYDPEDSLLRVIFDKYDIEPCYNTEPLYGEVEILYGCFGGEIKK